MKAETQPTDEDEPEAKTWKKIPSQVGQQLEHVKALIEKNPWDHEAREKLVKESMKSQDKVLIRAAFQGYLDQFPTNLRMWIKWIQYEKDSFDYDQIEKIFQECIKDVPCVELYSLYLEYIQHIHPTGNDDEEQEAQIVLTKTFDFILNVIGHDIESGPLWMEYIQFIKNLKVTSNYEEQQKMDHLRRVFHKAIYTPLHNIEDIWKEYDTFENNLSKLTAKKFISDRAAGYMTARAAIKDLKSLVEPINAYKNWVAVLPSWSNKELNLWKRYIAWEISNPLHLEEKGLLLARVMYAYKSALITLRHYPEIWYDAAMYLSKNDRMDDAIALLRNGLTINNKSLLIAFTLAEFLESKGQDFSTIQIIFDELLEKLDLSHNEINIKYDKERESLFKYLKDTLIIDDTGLDEGEKRERERELAKEHEKEVQLRVETKRKELIDDLKLKTSLVWIIYMRLSRRVESIRAARSVFSRARKSALITRHVFTASALMEYHVNKDAVVAVKIFELGMKSFPLDKDPHSAEYILRYLDFLICLNNDNNTRSLFERSVQSIMAEGSQSIWEKYLDYQIHYGDLVNLNSLEKRWSQVFPLENINSIDSVIKLAHKWSFGDINIVGEQELGTEALKRIQRLPPPAAQVKLANSSTNNDRKEGRQVAMLGGIDVEKFPRPEVSRWVVYKAEPGTAKVMNVKTIENTDSVEDEIPVSGGMLVAEPIAKFVSLLPKREVYDGPILAVKELIGEILKVQIELPTVTAKYVPLPGGKSAKRRREDEIDGV